jgi:hypothetical protein
MANMLNSQPNLCCRVQAYELDEPSHELGLIGFGSSNIAKERADSPLAPHHNRQLSPAFWIAVVGPLATSRHSNQYQFIHENGNYDGY